MMQLIRRLAFADIALAMSQSETAAQTQTYKLAVNIPAGHSLVKQGFEPWMPISIWRPRARSTSSSSLAG